MPDLPGEASESYSQHPARVFVQSHALATSVLVFLYVWTHTFMKLYLPVPPVRGYGLKWLFGKAED